MKGKLIHKNNLWFVRTISAEKKTNIEILQKYKHIYEHCMNKISGMLEEEMRKEK